MTAPSANDTIAALSSGRPPAAIAVIRLSGPDAAAAATAVAGPLPAPRQAVLRSFRDPASGEILDQGLLLFFPGPASATGEDIAEFQCHGGRAVVDALLSALIAQDGVRLAEPGEFTRRALASGRIDLTEAEGLADLLSAETEAQRRAARLRAGGQLRAMLEDWRDRLLALSAAAEVAIDYADEEDGAAAPPLEAPARALVAEVQALLDGPRLESLRDGLRIVFAGPPNSGKSSLVNALAKSERAIVTPIPGTTRDVIEVPIALEGLPLVLVDTAGLRESDDEVERIGVARSHDELEQADVIVWLGPASEAPAGKVLRIGSRSDIDPPDGGADLHVSAVTGEGISQLLQRLSGIGRTLVPGERQIALTAREAGLAEAMVKALEQVGADARPELAAEELRIARRALDRISGRVGVEDLLDQLFGRFCLGK